MKNILVLGGTRFFGQKVVANLINQGHKITLATRGNTQDSFGEKVTRLQIDRHDSQHPGWQELSKQDWDVVFDNICFTEEDAAIALAHLKKVTHYIVTSSLAVYEGLSSAKGFSESDFEPSLYTYTASADVSYGEGKRQTEAYFIKQAPYPISFLRFPIVLDDDDYTERLHFYLRKIRNHEEIIFRRVDGLFGFVKASEIPKAVDFVIANQLFGPLNIASSEPFTTVEFVAALRHATQIEPFIIIGGEDISPFSHYDSVLNTDRLELAGYAVTPLSSWLPDLMARIWLSEKN